MIQNHTRQALVWELGVTDKSNQVPSEYIPAVVPGAVQLDFARHLNYPDYTVADNYKLFAWTEDKFFHYRCSFKKQKIADGQQLWFVSQGIDYEFDILLNGACIHHQEGMFSPVEINLTERLQPDNRLEVMIYPAPKHHPWPADRTQASYSVKPPVGYLWDWHPRLIPCGIWDETYLEVRQSAHLKEVYLRYVLNEDFSSAQIDVEIQAQESKGLQCRWNLYDAQGKCVAEKTAVLGSGAESISATLDRPQLWWTHDHGTPYLYTSVTELVSPDGTILSSDRHQVGFKRIQLVMNEGAWDEPKGFPKSRSAAPAQFLLNGRPIFAKGSNWVAPDIFIGRITAERYQELVDIAVKANMNILRAWGGSAVSKEAFFDICDRAGILVWQEFPLACNQYPDDPHYLSVLEQEARSIVHRLRRHVSIGLWCGGNELFNAWSRMTDQSLPLRLLNMICFQLTPDIPFNATSPLNGMAHGHYLFRWDHQEVYQWIKQRRYTAYTEFGIPGISPREVLEKIIPANELFPPKPNTSWQAHHAYGAWDGDTGTWLCQSVLTKYFGEAKSLTELIDQSSTIQCEGYKAAFEQVRRMKPYSSIALNWCFNEPWPSAANNSLVVYPAVEKPAVKAVRDACRPVLASLEFDKYQWKEGESFHCMVWMLNDTFQEIPPQRIKVYLSALGNSRRIQLLDWESFAVGSNRNGEGPTLRYTLPRFNTNRIVIEVEVENNEQWNSRYVLAYAKSAKRVVKATASMNFDEN